MNLINFFKKPEDFIKNTPNTTFLYIFLLNMFVKVTYNIISPHKFPPEMNFNFAGIENPQLHEFLLANILSDILYFGVFIAVLTIHLKEKFITKSIFDLTFIALATYLFQNPTKLNYTIYLILFSSVIALLVKKNIHNYLILLKILISIQLINIASTILLYISEIISSNVIFIIVLFVYSITSFAYFIRLVKSFFDPSIKGLIFYLLISVGFAFYLGFVIYKINVFSSNTIKLIIYN